MVRRKKGRTKADQPSSDGASSVRAGEGMQPRVDSQRKDSIPARVRVSVVPQAIWLLTLATVLITAWQAYETRVSNRYTVRPMLQFISTSEVATSVRPVVGLYLLNKGMGPAKIVKVEATASGTSFVVNESGGLTKLADVLDLKEEWRGYEFDSKNDEIVMSQEMINFLIAGKSASGRELLSAITKLDIDVVYESVYGEEYTAKWRGSDSALAKSLQAYPPGNIQHLPWQDKNPGQSIIESPDQ